MSTLKYTKPEAISLKPHAEFTEKWLQERIIEDPSILGLGDIAVIDRERRQEKAGRLDLLMADIEEDRRFEVEIMLGQTDESHIIRCIEYWDIERRRYPAYDHVAVLVAEDITSRFLNLLSLFAGSLPLIVIQLSALKVGDQIVLSFVRVLDQVSLRRDDSAETNLVTTDRAYWNARVSPKLVDIADELLEIINQKATRKRQLNFNKYFIGLHDGVRSGNFVHFRPRKQFMHVMVDVADTDPWIEKLEAVGLPVAVEREGLLRVTVSAKGFKDSKEQVERLTELLHQSVAEAEA